MAEELIETTSFDHSFIKSRLLRTCGFYKPIKLNGAAIQDDDDYSGLNSKGYYNIACRYPRKNAVLKSFAADHPVFERFVELLASLTLYEFSKSSREIYYYCLDLRGLEYKEIDVYTLGRVPSHLQFDAIEGKRIGRPMNDRLGYFQICHVTLSMHFNSMDELILPVKFVKKHKIVILNLEKETFDTGIERICTTVCHPGIEHVNLLIKCIGPGTISLSKMDKMFDHFTNVKSVLLYFYPLAFSPDTEVLTGGSDFVRLKSMLENWAERATKLESFICFYQAHPFELHDKKLKRCIWTDDKWYLSNNCDIVITDYFVPCPFIVEGFDHLLPEYYQKLCYSDLVELTSVFVKQHRGWVE